MYLKHTKIICISFRHTIYLVCASIVLRCIHEWLINGDRWRPFWLWTAPFAQEADQGTGAHLPGNNVLSLRHRLESLPNARRNGRSGCIGDVICTSVSDGTLVQGSGRTKDEVKSKRSTWTASCFGACCGGGGAWYGIAIVCTCAFALYRRVRCAVRTWAGTCLLLAEPFCP